MKVTFVSLMIILIIFLLVFQAVIRGTLETKYAILWFITCIVLAILSINESLIHRLAELFGVYYAPSLLFLLGFLFSLFIIFDSTRRISNLNHKVQSLTQELAILKEKLERKSK